MVPLGVTKLSNPLEVVSHKRGEGSRWERLSDDLSMKREHYGACGPGGFLV